MCRGIFAVYFMLLFFLVGNVNLSFGQGEKAVNEAKVKGRLLDSAHNIVMQSATVALYHLKDNKLISYQLANSFGRFEITKVPKGIPLTVVASYLGYTSTKKEFVITEDANELELGTLNMRRAMNTLDEVLVTAVPPLRMRGDTLEFNADAFQLDANAVVEDMLRRLPGVTVWSDGLITVNGKKINKVLVEGKDFFGGDPKIALQNLPKNAVEKIQVYQDKSSPNVIDSTMVMNVNLKKDKKDGLFGKVGAGLGTKDYYDGNVSLSYFDRSNQISVVSAANNVNKTANNVNQLVALNSFKGEGIDNSYISDFKKKGLIHFKAAGLNFVHDFNKDLDQPNQTDKLHVNFFFDGNKQQVREHNQSSSFLHQNENIDKNTVNLEERKDNGFLWKVDYTKNFDNSSVNFFYNHDKNNFKSDQDRSSSTMNTNTRLSTKGNERSNILGDEQKINAGFNLVTKRTIDLNKSKFSGIDMNVKYAFDWKKSNYAKTQYTDFAATDSLLNKLFLRKYQNFGRTLNHQLTANINDVLALIKQMPRFFTVDFQHTIFITEERSNNEVNDLENKVDVRNEYLTNVSREIDFRYQTGFKVSMDFNKTLKNRYAKIWQVVLSPNILSFIQKNTSQKDFQQLRRSYIYFTPSANITYKNFQTAGNRNGVTLDYKTNVSFPTIDQLVPLIDNSNLYNIYFGNKDLTPEYNHIIDLKYSFDNGKALNPMLIEAGITTNFKDKHIADSLDIDSLGINRHYYINLKGYRRTMLSLSIQKAYKINTHQIQLYFDPNLSFYSSPSYLNTSYIVNKGNLLNITTSAVYSKDPYYTSKLGVTYTKNNSRNYNLNFQNWKTFLNLEMKINKYIFVSTQFEFNRTESSYFKAENYNIWNADIGCRFLKGANAEIKFSALDILRQNRNFTNFVTNNMISNSTVNTLQQHFILKLSYYPRVFGVKSVNDKH